MFRSTTATAPRIVSIACPKQNKHGYKMTIHVTDFTLFYFLLGPTTSKSSLYAINQTMTATRISDTTFFLHHIARVFCSDGFVPMILAS